MRAASAQYFGRCDIAHSLACSIGARGGSAVRSFLTVGKASILSRQRQKAGYLGYGFGLRREAKRIGAGQKIEVRKRKFGTEKILLGVRKLALRNCQPTTFSSDGIP